MSIDGQWRLWRLKQTSTVELNLINVKPSSSFLATPSTQKRHLWLQLRNSICGFNRNSICGLNSTFNSETAFVACSPSAKPSPESHPTQSVHTGPALPNSTQSLEPPADAKEHWPQQPKLQSGNMNVCLPKRSCCSQMVTACGN